ncbi:hypothetical protein [Derxia lacustris]|uniref:hypothetical protein n=1 Tax=Derxia lacustris TaxID=764842 RepID=UPI000A172990|nr:hypothetical protein [Derxia lacustris]
MPVHIGEFELTPAPAAAGMRASTASDAADGGSQPPAPEPPRPAALQQAAEQRRERALRSFAH